MGDQATDLDDLDIVELEAMLLEEAKIKETAATETTKLKSLIHSGDTDSSDDEDGKNVLEQKYNEYGRDIQSMLKSNEHAAKDARISREIDRAEREDTRPSTPAVTNKTKSTTKSTTDIRKSEGWTVSSIYVDPVFGMRIIRPLISSVVLKERMEGRTAVPMTRIANFLETGDTKQDWVIAGAIVSKTPVKKSQKGSTYVIWKLSDLKGDIKTISLFLFKNAQKDLWKTQEGTIIAILNPSVLDKRDNVDAACLSVDNPQKVMILGVSKDLGKCRSKKKNGEPCPAIVNLSSCDYCVYHVKQEYSKASKRSEFQSGMLGGRGLHDLRNKVLGKDQVFYAGQMFTAVRATKNVKQVAKDQNRLTQLSEYNRSSFQGGGSSQAAGNSTVNYAAGRPLEISAAKVEGSVKQRHKDLERLAKLGGDTSTLSPVSVFTPPSILNSRKPSNPITQSPAATLSSSEVPEKFRNREFSFTKNPPKLSQESFSFEFSTTPKSSEIAKLKALDIIKKKPIEKSNPNFIKHRGTDTGKKRALEELMNQDEAPSTINPSTSKDIQPSAKKIKLDEEEKAKNERAERLKAIIEAKSTHIDLHEARELEDQDKYFNTLEKKEAMEEKMLNTFKVACKAVICSQCKYVAFSASDRCKEEKHPLRVIDGEKRFFKCGDCGNRTVTLFRIPKVTCKNCQSSRWERTSMMREKKIGVGAQLSIRGDEETFIGSVNVKGGNINLLVPEEFV